MKCKEELWGDQVKPETYGLSADWISKVKSRIMEPAVMNQLQVILQGVTKDNLQSRCYVVSLIQKIIPIIGVQVSQKQARGVIQWILDEKIDPNNSWHLMKLWNTLRKY